MERPKEFVVLDSSFVLTWGNEEEGYEECHSIMKQVAVQGALAPALFATEVVEGLLKGVRRKRYPLERAQALAKVFARLGVTQDAHTWDKAWESTLRLAEELKLSVYDAAYLELASRTGLPLATFDGKLRRAAESKKVFLFPQVLPASV